MSNTLLFRVSLAALCLGSLAHEGRAATEGHAALAQKITQLQSRFTAVKKRVLTGRSSVTLHQVGVDADVLAFAGVSAQAGIGRKTVAGMNSYSLSFSPSLRLGPVLGLTVARERGVYTNDEAGKRIVPFYEKRTIHDAAVQVEGHQGFFETDNSSDSVADGMKHSVGLNGGYGYSGVTEHRLNFSIPIPFFKVKSGLLRWSERGEKLGDKATVALSLGDAARAEKLLVKMNKLQTKIDERVGDNSYKW